MLRAYARWKALGAADGHQLLGMMVGLPVIAASVRWFGIGRTARVLESLTANVAPRRADASDLQDAQRLAHLAAIAGRRGVLAASCLRQALLVRWLLRRRGFAPELKLGVRKNCATIDAHAWVVLQGVALGQAELSHVPFSGERLRGMGLG